MTNVIRHSLMFFNVWEMLDNMIRTCAFYSYSSRVICQMKLEKKRATSMDKIMNKLKSAQKKAQEMRSSVMENQSPEDTRTSSIKSLSFYRTRHMGSLSGCFTCHAF